MLSLVDKILTQIPYDTITDTEMTVLLDGSAASRHNQIKRALTKAELLHIRRGVYHLAKRYQRKSLNPYELAQKIYSPSYVSFESALSYHGLIPESVYSVSSASLKRSREFKTPVGVYSFVQIPQRVFYVGVDRIENNGQVFLMATPIKALCDYVFYHRPVWKNVNDVLQSLRIEMQDLIVTEKNIDELVRDYHSKRVIHFLTEMRKGLKQ